VTPRVAWLVPALATVLAIVAAGCGDDDDGGAGLGSPLAVEARQIAQRAGCTACHGADGEGGVGPGWAGSLGTEIELEDGTTVIVDEAYLTRAIADPQAEVHAGFDMAMPENRLTDGEIATLVEYIVALNSPPAPGG
jgi:cytochrome c oxidase subunit 2